MDSVLCIVSLQYKILLNTYAKPINANTLKVKKVEMVSYDNE